MENIRDLDDGGKWKPVLLDAGFSEIWCLMVDFLNFVQRKNYGVLWNDIKSNMCNRHVIMMSIWKIEN